MSELAVPARQPNPNIPVTWEGLSAHQARATIARGCFRTWCALPTPVRSKVLKVNSFSELNLSSPVLKAVASEGYEVPTPIQAQAIPYLMQGRDLLGIAQTGTGKTAAFALPILERMARHAQRPARNTCRALILSPTRELAAQIGESFRTYGRNLKVSRAVVFGGVSINKQISIMQGGVDVLVATPGRLVDLIERRAVSLANVEVFVLDEVDQMLDLGFIHAIRKIVGLLPKERQNLFFSATMPKEIAGLADALLKDPARVEVTPVATTVERITQGVIHVEPAQKLKLLNELLKDNNMTRTLVFTRTKHGADRVVKGLSQAGLNAAAIHGNKSQNNRERALAGFKAGKVIVLVATDIAARGIDVDGVSHVVNYDLPHVPESYVHRIGRTARAGADGTAIAFCTPEDRPLLRDIERTIRMAIPVTVHPLGIANVQPHQGRPGHPKPQQQRQQQQNQARRPHSKSAGQNSQNGKKAVWNPLDPARANGDTRNHSSGGGKPQRHQANNRNGHQPPRRNNGNSWMKAVSQRPAR